MYIWWSILTAGVCCGASASIYRYCLFDFFHFNFSLFQHCRIHCMLFSVLGYLMAFDCQELKGLLTYLLNCTYTSRHWVIDRRLQASQSSLRDRWRQLNKFLLIEWLIDDAVRSTSGTWKGYLAILFNLRSFWLYFWNKRATHLYLLRYFTGRPKTDCSLIQESRITFSFVYQ